MYPSRGAASGAPRDGGQGEVNRMEPCICRGLPGTQERILLLECLECEGSLVRCWQCGQVEWWPVERRQIALNAAEAHRWQTGHPRVVARGVGGGYEGHIVMEVGDA
jgi:hypothetical protein